jgi:hypothetical protein
MMVLVLMTIFISVQAGSSISNFPVIEFRRYIVKNGEREHFGRYFDTYFPEAFQQMGAMAFGQFLERNNPSTFTWIRGFQNYDARATVNTAFYTGPLWKEHAAKMNERILDINNVLLLKPLNPEKGMILFPAVDPLKELNGAQGIVVAQIFAVKENGVDEFAKQVEPTFAKYREAGLREAGVLATLDEKNNFPGLPFRTDGPFLVWFGIIKDNEMLEISFNPLAKKSTEEFASSELLRGSPELVIMDPTSRSRLRWIPEERK